MLSCILFLFKSRKNLIAQLVLARKKAEIAKRKSGKTRFSFSKADKAVITILNAAANIKNCLTLVSPETVLQ